MLEETVVELLARGLEVVREPGVGELVPSCEEVRHWC
jgi:hypothetical protein